MGREKILDLCRPHRILTDRRALNRARPPPIYLQREEEITPGVYPRAKLHGYTPSPSKSGNKTQQFPTELKNTPTISHTIQPKQTRKSMSEYRQRRVMSSDHVQKLQKAHSSSNLMAGSQSINPLQNRLARRSGSQMKKATSDRERAGSLRTSHHHTLYQGSKSELAVNPREFASSGYAHLRNRVSSIKSGEQAVYDRKLNRKTSASKLGEGGGGSLDSSQQSVRLPTIVGGVATTHSLDGSEVENKKPKQQNSIAAAANTEETISDQPKSTLAPLASPPKVAEATPVLPSPKAHTSPATTLAPIS